MCPLGKTQEKASPGTPRSACAKMLAFGATELPLKLNTPVGVSYSMAIPRALPVLGRHSASPRATRRKSLTQMLGIKHKNQDIISVLWEATKEFS